MKNSKFYWMLSIIVMAFVLTACGGGNTSNEDGASSDGSTDEGQTYSFKAGHSQTEEHPYHVALVDLAKNVEERTDGKVTIEIFPLNQLGAERELTEALSIGTADMSISSTAPIANFYPQIGIVDLPFLFESRDHAYNVLDGEVGQGLLAGLEDSDLIGLAWAENGFRHITNGKQAITKPEDLKGLKIRTQENQIHLDAFTALGAQPTPMAWNEALTALQQGVVDAQENPLIISETYKLHDANQTHMTLTGHIYSPAVVMFSKPIWDTIPSEYQDILREEAKIAGDKIRDLSTQADQDSLQFVKDNGVQVVEDVDVTPFREAIQSVYEKYEPQFGKENIEAILNGN
ncbi:TRAP transporter substrate-binding protein [Bacillus sp. B15-48]|uniref:TRAP transporter substrate-binding protein n=1 Tax=Bacillus sp. B15-48 TaxID=1548601 RepID=UPI00193ED0C3|nr:TRAP transporter substrate-binding protein [Bacillus sp. B15-48]MBM4761360.1 DctP family TRAP transporter solute-binding subunit [Bacillus sp. B15-48]